jgi:hypothetical protein
MHRDETWLSLVTWWLMSIDCRQDQWIGVRTVVYINDARQTYIEQKTETYSYILEELITDILRPISFWMPLPFRPVNMSHRPI